MKEFVLNHSPPQASYRLIRDFMTKQSHTPFSCEWTFNNASSRRNCSPMDLHFSFAATQLKFITNLISIPLFRGACWLLCPVICYDFKSTQKKLVWFELWTTLCTHASTVSGTTATFQSISMTLQEPHRNTHLMKAAYGEQVWVKA